jgi:lipopolysaccharide/colanic/teichoic acid biosynthesis glycosyltransferase
MAQVHGRDAISLDERTEWDDRYVEERSTRLDLQIMVRTVGTVFSNPGSDDETE